MTYDLTIRGGTLVTAEGGSRRADLGITDGKVAAVESSLPAGTEDIDASGLYVMPGGVDSHCHIEQKTSTGLTPVDDFYSAGCSALAGGTTTFVPFACQHRGMRIRDAVAEYRQTAGKAAVDYALHVIVSDPSVPHAAEDLRACFADGLTSVKVYMTYDALKLKDDELLDVLALCRAHGVMVMVHAESHDLIAWITRRLLSAECIAAKYHAAARPMLAEREATHRAITFAEFIGTPLLVVHVSSGEAADEIARARERGVPIFGETCPQYLMLTQKSLCVTCDAPGARPGEANKFLCSPPLRTEAEQRRLWAALRRGELQVISSDHSAYNFEGPPGSASKTAGGAATPFTKVPMGLPGLECRLPLMLSGARNGWLSSLEQAVAVCCANPARLYGCHPRKGALLVGSDADVVLWSAEGERTITKQALHDDVLDYTPYEGVTVRGEVVRTLLRGKTVFLRSDGDAGVLSAERGGGQFIPCGRPDLLGWSGNWPDDGDIVQQHVVATLGPKLDGETEGGEGETRASFCAAPSGATGSKRARDK